MNTLIMVTMYSYILKIKDIKDFPGLVSGDDVVMFLSQHQYDTFMANYKKYFKKDFPVKKQKYGFGMVMKDIEVTKYEFSFISRVFHKFGDNSFGH